MSGEGHRVSIALWRTLCPCKRFQVTKISPSLVTPFHAIEPDIRTLIPPTGAASLKTLFTVLVISTSSLIGYLF